MLSKKSQSTKEKTAPEKVLYIHVGGHSLKVSDIKKVEGGFVYLKSARKIIVSAVEAIQVEKILG